MWIVFIAKACFSNHRRGHRKSLEPPFDYQLLGQELCNSRFAGVQAVWCEELTMTSYIGFY